MMAFKWKEATRTLFNLSRQVYGRVSLYHASQHQCLHHHSNYNPNKLYLRSISSNVKPVDPIALIVKDLMVNAVHATEAVTNLHNKDEKVSRNLTHAVVTRLVGGEENRAEECLTFFKGIVDNKIPVKPKTYNILLDSLYRHKTNKQFFTLVELMKRNGIEPNGERCLQIMRMAVMFGHTDLAEVYFEKVKHSDKQNAYAILIKTYFYEAQNKSSDYYSKVLHYYNEMIDAGYKSSKSIDKIAVLSFSSIGDSESAHRVMEKAGLNDKYLYLIKHESVKDAIRNCVRSGDTESAYQLVEEFEVKEKDYLKRFIQNESVKEAIINCVRSGYTEVAYKLVEESEVEDKEHIKRFIKNVKYLNILE